MNRLEKVPLGDSNDLGIVVADNNISYISSQKKSEKNGSSRKRENLQQFESSRLGFTESVLRINQKFYNSHAP